MSSDLSNPIHALAISPGVAIGPVRLYGTNQTVATVTTIHADQVEAEQQRLREALTLAKKELQTLSEQVALKVGDNEAAILTAQQLMLEDPDLLAEVQELITQQHLTAACALQQAAEQQAQELETLGNELFAARAMDIRDAITRVTHHLIGKREESLPLSVAEPMLIVANDLTPSDTASLDARIILGICTVVGGPTTHAAILARALEIPAIAGIDPRILSMLHDHQHIAIDGTQGLLYLQLSAEQREQLHVTMNQQREEKKLFIEQNEQKWRRLPGATADGYAVQIFANVGDRESAQAAGEAGAEGIGLLRTEFLFGGRPILPDEQEQFESYKTLFLSFVATKLLGATIVARTLDAGADKPFPALEPVIGVLQEANPALGLRGIRIHLAHEELLRSQLRALLRASATTGVHLHIMFPMIATLEEVRHVGSIYRKVQRELESEGINLPGNIQIGIMIETPAAALMADVLVHEIDFFSIGANDLYQYTMAADRTNSHVMGMFGRLEPAVWRLIERVVRIGNAHRKTVAVCGEIAADPKIGPLLVGLGVQELSMNPPAIGRVKAALYKHSLGYWQHLAQEMLKAETAAEMQKVYQFIP